MNMWSSYKWRFRSTGQAGSWWGFPCMLLMPIRLSNLWRLPDNSNVCRGRTTEMEQNIHMIAQVFSNPFVSDSDWRSVHQANDVVDQQCGQREREGCCKSRSAGRGKTEIDSHTKSAEVLLWIFRQRLSVLTKYHYCILLPLLLLCVFVLYLKCRKRED